ncbi:MAG: LysM peptidoglycan-binding domain-containing protein [Cyclobacteriaceae bacterium]
MATGTLVALNSKVRFGATQEPIQFDNSGEVAELANVSFNWTAEPAQKIEATQASLKSEKQNIADLTPIDSTATSFKNEVVSKQEPTAFIYEVKSSDTLYGIARQFGATIKELMDWNNKSSFAISPGEKLKIIKR